MVVEQRYDAQHILVVFIVAYSLSIGIEEGHILLLWELLGELVDVDSLVVGVHIVIVESVLRYEIHDVLIIIETHHRAVHPRLVLGNQCQVGVGILDNHGDDAVAEDEIALYEQGVVFLKFVLDDGQRIDIVGLVVNGILGKFYVQRADVWGLMSEERFLDVLF